MGKVSAVCDEVKQSRISEDFKREEMKSYLSAIIFGVMETAKQPKSAKDIEEFAYDMVSKNVKRLEAKQDRRVTTTVSESSTGKTHHKLRGP